MMEANATVPVNIFMLNLPVIIPLLYAVPSFALNILLSIVLLQTFKHSFYRLFVLTAISDIFVWFFGFIALRATNASMFFAVYDILPQKGFVIDLVNFLAYYGTFVQSATSFFVSLNRFTAAVVPFRHVKIWKNFIPYVVIITLLFPIPFTYHIFEFGGYLEWRNPKNVYDGYRLDVDESISGPRNALYGGIVAVVHGVTLIFMNTWIAISLFLRRRQATNSVSSSGENTKDTELMLFLYSLFLFVFSLMRFAGQFAFFFFGEGAPESYIVTAINIQMYASDVYTCSAPWLLLVMSRAVREEMRRRILRLKRRDSRANYVFKSRVTLVLPSGTPK